MTQFEIECRSCGQSMTNFRFFSCGGQHNFNRPGVAGAVLQSASWFIHSVSQSVSQPFPPNLQNIINRKPEELGSWNFERMFTPHNMSHVTCRMSRVTCHMWHVTCHMSHVTCCIFFFSSFLELSGEAYWWRVCYQWGLPRLVFKASALWADAFYKSICPSVCVSVRPSVCPCVCLHFWGTV